MSLLLIPFILSVSGATWHMTESKNGLIWSKSLKVLNCKFVPKFSSDSIRYMFIFISWTQCPKKKSMLPHVKHEIQPRLVRTFLSYNIVRGTTATRRPTIWMVTSHFWLWAIDIIVQSEIRTWVLRWLQSVERLHVTFDRSTTTAGCDSRFKIWQKQRININVRIDKVEVQWPGFILEYRVTTPPFQPIYFLSDNTQFNKQYSNFIAPILLKTGTEPGLFS